MKTKLLILETKHEIYMWNITSAQQERAGWLVAFNYLDNNYNSYKDIKELNGTQQNSLYMQAKLGEPIAAEHLLKLRRDYDCEGWDIEWAMDPLLEL